MLKLISVLTVLVAATSSAVAGGPDLRHSDNSLHFSCKGPEERCLDDAGHFGPKQLTRAQALARAAAAFDRADVDRNGVLSSSELKNARPRWKDKDRPHHEAGPERHKAGSRHEAEPRP